MYAVIRSGGKQYRVAPGEIVRIEKLPTGEGDKVEFKDVLAVSAEEGKIGPGVDALVTGQVMENSRADKILVFHFKRKKQYKKIYGHRQPYTAVRITQIAFDGQKFDAPELPKPRPKKVKAEASETKSAAPAKAAAGKASAKKSAKPAAKKAAKGRK
jgi:large subunit ribosomal protein L21